MPETINREFPPMRAAAPWQNRVGDRRGGGAINSLTPDELAVWKRERQARVREQVVRGEYETLAFDLLLPLPASWRIVDKSHSRIIAQNAEARLTALITCSRERDGRVWLHVSAVAPRTRSKSRRNVRGQIGLYRRCELRVCRFPAARSVGQRRWLLLAFVALHRGEQICDYDGYPRRRARRDNAGLSARRNALMSLLLTPKRQRGERNRTRVTVPILSDRQRDLLLCYVRSGDDPTTGRTNESEFWEPEGSPRHRALERRGLVEVVAERFDAPMVQFDITAEGRRVAAILSEVSHAA